MPLPPGELGNLWTRATPPGGAHQGDLWVDPTNTLYVFDGTNFVPAGLGVVNVKSYGAKGDGVTDDSAAIQAAINAAGTSQCVWFPKSASYYLCGTGLTVSSGSVMLAGPSCDTFLKAASANLNLLTITGPRCVVKNLGFVNFNRSTAASALVTLSGAVECKLENLFVIGGYYGVRVIGGGADNVLDLLDVYNTYGGAHVYITAGGTYVRRCKLDQPWPATAPSGSNFKGAWAGTTAYALKDVVVTQGYKLQCTVAGTSGGVAPTLAPYETDITDGTATWRMAQADAASSIDVDSGCSYAVLEDVDMTGPFEQGLLVHDSLATTPPQKIVMRASEIGGVCSYGVNVVSGAGILIEAGCTIDNGLKPATAGVQLASAAEVQVRGCLIFGWTTGVSIGASTKNVSVQGNDIHGCTTGVGVGANATDFSVEHNNLGTSANWGSNTTSVSIASGTSDYYRVFGNVVHGSGAVSDGGSGTHKVVQGNIGGPYSATADVTTSQTTTSTSYTDLATSGPAVTLSPGATQTHLLLASAQTSNTNTGVTNFFSVAVNGAAAADVDGGAVDSGTANIGARVTRPILAAAQPNGATHTMKYRTTGGTAAFASRRLVGTAL